MDDLILYLKNNFEEFVLDDPRFNGVYYSFDKYYEDEGFGVSIFLNCEGGELNAIEISCGDGKDHYMLHIYTNEFERIKKQTKTLEIFFEKILTRLKSEFIELFITNRPIRIIRKSKHIEVNEEYWP
ncbi:MAG: hypothetical protein I8H98_09010 [Moraxellaceae bacterium]|nr:hypothetical protein [Moraxellaceae bacterium]